MSYDASEDSTLVVVPWEDVDTAAESLPHKHTSQSLEQVRHWEEHIRNGHTPKIRECSICERTDGPVEVRPAKAKELAAVSVLHVDLAGAFEYASAGRARFLMVGAYRGITRQGQPTAYLPLAALLQTK